MKELNINEMTMVAGGFSLPSVMTSAAAINSLVGSYSYLGYSYLSGNEATPSGVLGAAAAGALWGGVAGTATLKGATVAIGTSSTAGAIEGTANGNGPIGKGIRNYINDITTSYNQRLEDVLSDI